MTKLAPEWVRTSDPVIRNPARYRWTTAPASTIFGLSSRVRSKTYIDILKLLDQQKCTERQYSALIVGNKLHTDCGTEISTRFSRSKIHLRQTGAYVLRQQH